MKSRIECFWMEPIERARVSLRRYENHPYDPMPPPSCPNNRMKYHDTSVVIGDEDYPFGEHGYMGGTNPEFARDDPRWPKQCHVCGYEFKDDDIWQCNLNRLFKGAPDGKLYTNRDMPPGALFDATWISDKGPDGICLAVVLPPEGGDNIWMPDTRFNQENRILWTRTGTVPKITCTPSILTPQYHGWLRDGFLVEC